MTTFCSIYKILPLKDELWGGIACGSPSALVGEADNLVLCDGEKLNRGPGMIIPFRLGDLDMFLETCDPGSCNGNRDENFICCIILRCSAMVLIVGLSDGSV